MHRTTKIGALTTLAAAAAIASATTANAIVTINSDGKGFVGKGDHRARRRAR